MKKPLPPLKALPMFEAAARHLNFRLAAEEMHLTQGAVAQQVRGLEAYLGQDLFERKARGLSLTAQGKRYHQEIAKALDIISEASKDIESQSQSLTLSLTPSLATKWLMPRLGTFTGQHPEIDVKILATEKLSELDRQEADLAIRLTKPPFAKSLRVEPFLPMEIRAYAAPSLFEHHPHLQQGLDASCAQHIPLLTDAHNHWPSYWAMLRENQMPAEKPHSATASARQHLHFNQTALAIEAAVAGQGVVLAPQILVEREIALGSLLPVGSMIWRNEEDFYLVYPRRAQQSQALRHMIEWLKKISIFS
ncbi:MAG: LysR substrate-binding domain-containing protein [Cohaesibacter sp.]|nr:LysR substrate-binding domain-containing protein [Cohaesibacter sp.]